MKIYSDHPTCDIELVAETPEEEQILNQMALWPGFYPKENFARRLTLAPSEKVESFETWVMPLTAWMKKEAFSGEVLLPLTEAIVPKLLSQLKARERKILEMWLGINEPPKSLKKIGLTFGISGGRVQQIKNKIGWAIRGQLKDSKLLRGKSKL